MTRTQYKAARKLIRANGRYAIRWLDAGIAEVMDVLFFGQADDLLAERQQFAAYLKSPAYLQNKRH